MYITVPQFWSKRPGELASRWANFAGISAPWLTSMANAVISGRLAERQAPLAAAAVENLEKLGAPPLFFRLSTHVCNAVCRCSCAPDGAA